MEIPLSRPDITELEIEAVLEVLRTPNLSLGPKLPEFETQLANYVGAEYAVVVNSGTAALHLAMISCGITQTDEVITSPFSFVSSSNCILFESAMPRFIDIRPESYNINPELIKTFLEKQCTWHSQKKILIDKQTQKTVKAILPVHVFGEPCEMDSILDLAEKYNLMVIEDSCEALGSEYQQKKVGTFGKIGTFAFYPNKQMTTGEGGVLLTDSEEIAQLSRSLRNQGRSTNAQWLQHERLGYNYRLSDINCALGIAQLSRIEEIINKRHRVACLYNEYLHDIEEIYIPEKSIASKKSWFVYVIRLSEAFDREDRNAILTGLRRKGVSCRNYFSPIHLQPFYQSRFGYQRNAFPVTEHVSDRTIALPFFNDMSEEQVAYVVEALRTEIKEISHKYLIALKELNSGCDLGPDPKEEFREI